MIEILKIKRIFL